MTERIKMALVVLLVVVALVLCVLSARTVRQADNGSAGFALTSAASAPPASGFTLAEAATGERVSLQSAVRKGPVVLDFWATWCGPCRAELPDISAVARKYQGRVAFYGVNFSDSPANIRAFSKAEHIPFPTLVDARHAVADAYGADSIPRLAVIDTHDRVRLLVGGYDPEADIVGDLSRDLNSLLAGN